jgi:hypothetical protein
LNTPKCHAIVAEGTFGESTIAFTGKQNEFIHLTAIKDVKCEEIVKETPPDLTGGTSPF